MPQNVRDAITIIPAESVSTVLETALCEKPKAKKKPITKEIMPGMMPAASAEPAVHA